MKFVSKEMQEKVKRWYLQMILGTYRICEQLPLKGSVYGEVFQFILIVFKHL